MQCHSKEASRHSIDEVGGFAPLHRERDLSSDLLGEGNYTQRTYNTKVHGFLVSCFEEHTHMHEPKNTNARESGHIKT